MRILWNLVKFAIALALVIPIAIIVLATALGLFAAMLGLAVLALKIAVAVLIVWGVIRLGRALFGGSSRRSWADESRQLAPVDPYYEAAKRELDRELGGV